MRGAYAKVVIARGEPLKAGVAGEVQRLVESDFRCGQLSGHDINRRFGEHLGAMTTVGLTVYLFGGAVLQ